MVDFFTNQQEPTKCSWCGSGSYGKKEATPWDESAASLAQEMNELSVKEREQVFDDIHGVAEIQEETEQFKTTCLEDVDFYLDRIQKAKRRALDRALFLKPSLLDVKFKLKFLRADQYDPCKAAQRIAKHFEVKLRLFGEDRLTRNITLNDLEEKDVEQLNVIGCVILSHRDPVGRPIWFFDIPALNFDDGDSMMRCLWYQAMITMEDETAQLKGVCDVGYCPGDMFAMPSSVPKFTQLTVRAGELLNSVPCRITAFQFCYNDVRVKYAISTIGMAFGKSVRLRSRTHYGSDVEIQYSLMTFGIVCHYLFHSAKGDGRRKSLHDNHIQRRHEIERKEEESRTREEARSGIIMSPQPYDVLVGRGRPYQEYPGNLRLVSIVESRLSRYRNTDDRFEKTCIIIEAVRVVHDSGGRFLQKTPQGCWKVASDKAAREKTASAFRSSLDKANTDETKHGEDATNSPSSMAASNRNPKRARVS